MSWNSQIARGMELDEINVRAIPILQKYGVGKAFVFDPAVRGDMKDEQVGEPEEFSAKRSFVEYGGV